MRWAGDALPRFGHMNGEKRAKIFFLLRTNSYCFSISKIAKYGGFVLPNTVG
jgi:hypothetical protein